MYRGCWVGIVCLLVGCGGATTEHKASHADEATVRTNVEQAKETGCLAVPFAVHRQIENSLYPDAYGQPVLLGSLSAVRSNDFKSVYFVSAEIIDDPPRGDETDPSPLPAHVHSIGTWALATGKLLSDARIFAINVVAQEMSHIASGDEEDANLTMNDDGAKESQRCDSS